MRPTALAAVLLLAACQPAPEEAAPSEAPAAEAAPQATLAAQPPSLSGAWVRASLGRNPNTGGYVTVANPGAEADRLVAAACDCAERVELHTVSTEGGVMRMSQVDGFDVPAGGTLSLAPGGDHLMFLGLARPLQAGETVRVTLTFERGGEVAADFPVRTAPAAGDADHAGD